ncbi:polysaccharide pyruvyl transferase family protein [Flammeovirga pacifica]|uniref:Polysaccharide pyruvyl transferase domain-containing protein n=1 Tax=Flammeovirga pacifica TaxID=915059 RepID=A0A1S1Z170_FLAPC|nr:polysaccharide pyruvyl transferase family protein [Flammeovirga pacifica]OHX67016.1 hypothetical protein NH26_12010 [Flammeovirga pacifica]
MKNIVLIDAFSTLHVGNGVLLDQSIKVFDDLLGENNYKKKILTKDLKTNSLRYDSSELLESYFGTFWEGKSFLPKLIWIITTTIEFILLYINNKTFRISPKKIVFSKKRAHIISIIQKADVCASINGEMINDTFKNRSIFWLFFFWLITDVLNKKLVLFPQSYGPLKDGLFKRVVKRVLDNANLVVARDLPSYNLMKGLLNEGQEVVYSPDVGFMQTTNSMHIDIKKYFTESNDKKIIGVTISKIVNEINYNVDYYSEILNSLIESFDVDSYKFLIMPSNYIHNGKSNDYLICERLYNDLRTKSFEVNILENKIFFPDEYQSLQKQLNIFITTRMHVGIISTSAYVPTISINTQHKIRGYMTNIQMQDYCIDLDKMSNMTSVIKKIKENRDRVIETLKHSNDKMLLEMTEFKQKLMKNIEG